MRIGLIGILGAAVAVSGCSSESETPASPAAIVVPDTFVVATGQTIYGQQQTHVTIKVGAEVGLHLGTVGFGAFDSLPVVSSTGLRFVDEAVVGPYIPSGPQQLFRFVAVAPGRVTISFPHSPGFDGQSYNVVDTVDVR